jgi:SAM-dependent MidA family methyltransferase
VPRPGRAGIMSELHDIIAAEARERGVISFARFMELALYCPKFGYYEREDTAPGRRGDFYTSVSVGGLFGELLAFRFARWLGELPPGRRQIVEAGAHDGRLALDILLWLREHRPELVKGVEYWILEPSAGRRERQRKTLGEMWAKVRWFQSWDSVPYGGVNGVIFSNELLDAMPVHRLGWDALNKKWFEWGVSVEEDNFVWSPMSVPPRLLGLGGLAEIPGPPLLDLPVGFSTEVSEAAYIWWTQASVALKSGKLVTFDYGLEAPEFLLPQRKDGTLRAYSRHHVDTDLLAFPGEKDLTAHVNFTMVEDTGERIGLVTDTFQSQEQFLVGILAEAQATGGLKEGTWTGARTRQFQTLTHPEHLGRAFRVLVQSRPASPQA